MANHSILNPEPPQSIGVIAELRRSVPSLILTAAIAFGTSWWNSQLALNDLRYQVNRLEEKQREMSATLVESSQTSQRDAIRMAELSVIQTNIAEQLKEIKTENEKLLRR